MLVAQPGVVYSTYFGGSGAEVVTASAVDERGRVWVTGYTLSADLPISNAPFLQVRPGQRDIFVAQIDTTAAGGGSLLYASYIGGTGNDDPTCIAVSGGFVYIGGTTSSTDFPLAGQAYLPNPPDTQNAFFLKLDPSKGGSESLVYSTYLGGSGFDRINAIAVRNGIAYAAGYTTSDDFPAIGALSNASKGGGDAFVSVFDTASGTAAATLPFSSVLSGIAFDNATAIGVNTQGDIYVAGTTASADFTVSANAYQNGYQGGTDVFLVRINANRSRVYSSFLGGALHDVPLSLSVTGTDLVTLAGYTLSGNFPTTDGAPRRDAAGGADAFVARLNLDNPSAGQLTFSTLVGGNDGDVATGVTAGANGTLLITGYTLSDDFPVVGEALQNKNAGAIDAFVAQIDPAGRVLRYSTLFGGASVDGAVGIHSLNNCEVVFAGQTQSRAFKVTESGYQNALNGLSDAFVTRASICAAGQ